MLTLSALITAFAEMPTITNGAALTRYMRLHPTEVRYVAPGHTQIIDRAGRYAARAIVARSDDARNRRHRPPIARRPARTESPRC